MKLGILGTGKIVQEFLPWLVEHTPFTVQAVCSTPRSAAKAAELCAQYQIPQHTTNYFELLQWVDAVYIAVPNLQHARYARVALEAGKHVIVEKPMAVTAAETEELAALAQRKRLFLFEAMTTQYQPNYAKLRELLPRVGTVRMVQCSFSQYSSRYDAFCNGQTPPVFDPLCAGGALMDLGVYNVSYIVGLFGEPNKAVYAANMERNIDTSGVLMMDYSGFKAVSLAAKDCAAPARCIIQGTKGYILQKSTPNYCGGVTFHPNEGKEEHYNLNGDRPRQAAEFEAFYRAMTAGDQELCARMLDTSIAVSRVLTVDKSRTWSYILSAMTAPALNTLFFMGYIVLAFYGCDYVQNLVSVKGAANPFMFVVLLVGVQGVAEFLVSGILGGIVARAVAKFLK